MAFVFRLMGVRLAKGNHVTLRMDPGSMSSSVYTVSPGQKAPQAWPIHEAVERVQCQKQGLMIPASVSPCEIQNPEVGRSTN